MRAVGTHRSRRGAGYNVYVSQSGREQRRRRQRRQRRLLVVALVVVIAAGVFVAGGWAQDLYKRLTGSPAPGRRPPGTASSPAASGVLITTVTTVVPVDPPPVIVSAGRRRQGQLVPRRRDAAGVRPGAAAQAPLPHLEDLHRRRPDVARPEGQEAPTSPGRAAAGPASPSSSATRASCTCSGARFDRKLHKIDLKTGKVVWEYDYDDIIKSSPTVIEDPQPQGRRRQVHRHGRLAPRLAVGLHRPQPGAVPGRLVRHRQGALAPAGAAHAELQPRRGRQRLLLQGPHVLGGRERVVLQARPLQDRAVERLPEAEGHRQPPAARRRRRTRRRTRATWSSRRRRACSTTSSTSAPAPATCTACAGATSRSSGTTAPAATWTARRCRPSAGKLLVAVEKQYISGHGGDPHARPVQGPRRLGRLVLPDRRPQAGRLGGRRDRVGRPSTTPTTRGAAAPASPRSRPSTATSTWSRRTRPRAAPRAPTATGRTPRRGWSPSSTSGGSISTPIMVDDTIVAAGYDNRIHLYKIKYAPAEKGDAGALKSPVG